MEDDLKKNKKNGRRPKKKNKKLRQPKKEKMENELYKNGRQTNIPKST